MIAAASIAARAVTIDPDQADYYRGLGEDLFSRWEDVTGEDYRSVDMGIKRTEYREDRYRKGALRALEHSLRLLPARDDGLLPRNLGYTIEADDVGRWTLQGLVDAHAKPKAKTKRRKRR